MFFFQIHFLNLKPSLDLFSTIEKCFFHRKHWSQKINCDIWQVYFNMSKLIVNHIDNLFLLMIFFTNGFLIIVSIFY
jgi:hypothetical protein